MQGNVPIPESPHADDVPVLHRAFTIDIETLALPGFRERVGPHLERSFRHGNMRLEQQQRYLEDIAAEEERCYQLGSLTATTGRVLSIAVHVGSIPGIELLEPAIEPREYVFGINVAGNEESEHDALRAFLSLLSDFDSQNDEIVGHNILSFDLPFIVQRCLINNIEVQPFARLTRQNMRAVFDTMRHWWLGERRTVSLDDLAWALGIESSKTSEVEGSKVFDLYQAGKLVEIRQYNLNDVRLTRKVYERMVACFGR
jgi:DNA polymerase elongation subunit (family B)